MKKKVTKEMWSYLEGRNRCNRRLPLENKPYYEKVCTSFKYQVSCYFIHETLKFLIIATGFSNHSSYAYVNRNKMPQEKITINHNKKSQETFKSSHVKNVVFFSHIMLRPLLVMQTQDLLCSDR